MKHTGGGARLIPIPSCYPLRHQHSIPKRSPILGTDQARRCSISVIIVESLFQQDIAKYPIPTPQDVFRKKKYNTCF